MLILTNNLNRFRNFEKEVETCSFSCPFTRLVILKNVTLKKYLINLQLTLYKKFLDLIMETISLGSTTESDILSMTELS